MENNSAEPRLSSYLHAKACRAGTPLAGNFELTPRCNFNCKMCYVHLSEAEQKRRGAELSADEWLSIAYGRGAADKAGFQVYSERAEKDGPDGEHKQQRFAYR